MDSLGPEDGNQPRSEKAKQTTPISQDDEDSSRTALLGPG